MDQHEQQPLIELLGPSISKDRLGTYLKATGFDGERALRLYIWNAYVGEAFHLPVQAVEVGLRNRVNATLDSKFGTNWWKSSAFLELVDRERKNDIETAKRRILNRKSDLVTSQIVANLSFGFWVGMLKPGFNPQIWSSYLRTSFQNLPSDKTRYDLYASVKRISDLRNRIWHHEPIFRMDLSNEFRAVMEALGWICPIKAGWIRPQCRVPQILREKP